MKTTVEDLRDYFKISYDAYRDSREEASRIEDLYHNRQYTSQELAVLENRGQPPETFNVVKMFSRMLLGYYSTVVNTVNVQPRQQSDILTASLLNDIVKFTMEDNQFETEGDKIKQDGLIHGIMCVFENVIDTGEKDEFGRKIKRIELSHVPAAEIALDPASKLEDYSDARWIHRFKWLPEDTLRELFPKKQSVIDGLDEYYNHLEEQDTEFEKYHTERFEGRFKQYDAYLLVHSIVTEKVGKKTKTYSVFWIEDQILEKKEVSFRDVRFPYRVHKLNTSNKTEYYGVFREVEHSQKAINQAVVKIQLMVNTQKAFVQEDAIEDLDEFTDQFNRVNAVIPVKSLNGIRVENLAREVLDQYAVIDRALNRIQKVLGINDSFLGIAFASDSGRKVEVQKNSTIIALRHITARIQQFYRLLGYDITHLVKQFYTATQSLRIADDVLGQRWAEINQPLMVFQGNLDEANSPILEPVFEEVIDPETGEPEIDEDGNFIFAPVPDADTEVAFSDVDISIDSTAYNDEDEKNQQMLDTFMNSGVGQAMMQVNPAGYFKAASLSVSNVKTKHAADIAAILDQTAAMLTPQQEQQIMEDASGNSVNQGSAPNRNK